MAEKEQMFGIYRITNNNGAQYVSRTVTNSRKLADQICADWNRGVTITPWGAEVTLKRKGKFEVREI